MTQQRAGWAGPRPVPRGLRPPTQAAAFFSRRYSGHGPRHQEVVSRPRPSFSSF